MQRLNAPLLDIDRQRIELSQSEKDLRLMAANWQKANRKRKKARTGSSCVLRALRVSSRVSRQGRTHACETRPSVPRCWESAEGRVTDPPGGNCPASGCTTLERKGLPNGSACGARSGRGAVREGPCRLPAQPGRPGTIGQDWGAKSCAFLALRSPASRSLFRFLCACFQFL